MIEGSQPRRLTVEHLSIRDLRGNDIVTDANFTVEPGSVLAVIGESGCGKTSVALSLLGYARPGMKVGSGRVMVGDIDVLALDKRTRRALRGQSSRTCRKTQRAASIPGNASVSRSRKC